MYMELRHRLQQDIGDHDVDYHLIADGLVRFRDNIYVMNESELKKTILQGFHAKPYLSHLGYQNTLKMVKNFYYWQNMKEVTKFVARFLDCQQVKVECKHTSGLLLPILIPKGKWEVISMDFFTCLSRTSRKNDSIMVVVDRLMKV